VCYTCRAGSTWSSNDVVEFTDSETIDLTEVVDEEVQLVEGGDNGTTERKSPDAESTVRIIYPVEWTYEEDLVLLTKEDIGRLRPRRWISGAIVDFYSCCQLRRLRINNVKGALVVNNFTWTKMKSDWDTMQKGGFVGKGRSGAVRLVPRRTRRFPKFFDQRHIIMPIVFENHWSVLYISHLDKVMNSGDDFDAWNPCIVHLNSMREYHDDVDVCVRHFLLQEFTRISTVGGATTLIADEGAAARSRFCGGEKFPTLKPALLRQSNDDDCGVFACHYIQLLCDLILKGQESGASLDLGKTCTRNWFTQSHIAKKRTEILHMIVDVIQEMNTTWRHDDILHHLNNVVEGNLECDVD
jgi:Ulp1 family protease